MKLPIMSAAMLALSLAAAPAMASGSGGGGGGGGGGFGNSGFGSGSGISQTDRLLRQGRSQVRKRITCSKCEYHDRLNGDTAAEVARGVREGKFDIKERHRSAVLFYLRDRYGI